MITFNTHIKAFNNVTVELIQNINTATVICEPDNPDIC